MFFSCRPCLHSFQHPLSRTPSLFPPPASVCCVNPKIFRVEKEWLCSFWHGMHLLLFSLPVLSGGGGLFYPGHFYAFNQAHCVNVSLFMGWMISFPGSLTVCVRAHVVCFILIIKGRKCCFMSVFDGGIPSTPLHTHTCTHTRARLRQLPQPSSSPSTIPQLCIVL